jgi:hypothetical protein
MTPQDHEGEWIQWAGGECPTNPEAIVEIRGRYGACEVERADYWCWDWMPSWPDSDIVAYRIIP